MIPPAMGPSFVEGLTVERIHGVGPATAAKTNRLGILTALDLRAKDPAFLRTHFGKAGLHYYNICRGIDHRPVCADRVRKSVGAETTFSRDLASFDEMKVELAPLIEKVWRYCASTGVRARTVTLKLKFADFQIITRSRTSVSPVTDCGMFASISTDILAAQCPMQKKVRLIGVSLTSLSTEWQESDPQLALAL